MRKRSTPEPTRRGRGAFWTTSRASAIGAAAGLVAILISILEWDWRDALLLPWFVATSTAALCGLSILWITAVDMLTNPRRGAKVAPIRGFDIAMGLLLALPSLYALSGLMAS
jgi:hypothetical protein